MMKRSISAIALLCLALFACAAVSALGYNVELDGGGLRGYSPEAQARATTEAMRAESEATRAAVQAETARQAQGGAALGQALTALGLGVGALVLAIGGAFAVTAWLNKHATSVYPNAAGQYPVIVKRSWNGVTIVHDPNRAIGPTTIYTVPALPGLPAEATIDAPLNASEAGHVQIASQAQAVGLMAAATRPTGLLGEKRKPEDVARLAQSVVSAGAGMARLPAVRVVDDPAKVAEFERMLAEGE